MNKIKILLVDDHNIVRQGVISLLENEQDIEIVGHVRSVDDCMELLSSGLAVDLILADINMPGQNGFDLIKAVKETAAQIKVLILTMLEDTAMVYESVAKGADGYLLKSIDLDQLLYAIRHVAAGGKYICSEMVFEIIYKQNLKAPEEKYEPAIKLSEREAEVLALIAEGFTNQEIADKLFSSRRTIEGHRLKLLEKTGTSNTATLIRFAGKNGMI